MNSESVATVCRRAKLQIDLGAILHNYFCCKQHIGTGALYAVLKANAYGHGLQKVAAVLKNVDGFAVACMAEARVLRAIHPSLPIICLQGFVDKAELKQALIHRIECVIHQAYQLEILYNATDFAADLHSLKVWLKVDSGMHRLGFAPDAALEILQSLQNHQRINALGILSHMAAADDLLSDVSLQQLQVLADLTATAQALIPNLHLSFANSSAMCAYRDSRQHVQRLGLALYGVNPFVNGDAPAWLAKLRPAMRLSSSIIAINEYQQGARIGYSGTYQVRAASEKLAVVAIGYGDGYPLQASNQSEVYIAGVRCPLRGRVSMDMLCVDISHCPEARIGSEVVLFGAELPVEILAKSSGNHAYNLLCAPAGRVAVEYI